MQKAIHGILQKLHRHRLATVAVLAGICVVITGISLSVHAAFVGKGTTKGVLTGAEHYFTSNILTQTGSVEDVKALPVNCNGNEQLIQIRNFDPVSGNCNTFDITYKLYVWLSDPTTDADHFTYYFTIGNGRQTALTVTTAAAGLVEGTYTLEGKEQNTNFLRVGFEPKDAESATLSPDCGICVAAVPVLPGFMTGTVLGGTVTKSYTVFAIDGSFQSQSTPLTEMAGFLYEVTSSGVPTAEQTVTLTWDAGKLEFDAGNLMPRAADVTYVVGEKTTAGSIDTQICSLTFSPTESYRFFKIAFYRKSSPFWDTATWADVNALVTTQLNQ